MLGQRQPTGEASSNESSASLPDASTNNNAASGAGSESVPTDGATTYAPPPVYLLDLALYLATDKTQELIKFLPKKTLPKEFSILVYFFPEYLAERKLSAITDWDDFYDVYEHKNSAHPYVRTLCTLLQSHTPTSVTGILQDMIDACFAEQAAEEALRVAVMDKGASMDKVQSVLDAHLEASVISRRTAQAKPVTDISELLLKPQRQGLSWPLDCMNKILNPFVDQFMMIAARPDGGKTTLVAQIAWHAALQIEPDEQVLWFMNEESLTTVVQRVVCSAFNLSVKDIEKNRESVVKAFKQKFQDRIVFLDNAVSTAYVEKNIAIYKPRLIIMDQLYKIVLKGDKNETAAERIRHLCQWARDIGKYVAPVIATNQLDGTAQGQKYPSMEKLDGSKTGAQGELDVLCTIGQDPSTPNSRYLYFPKNKMTGKAGGVEVHLDKEHGRYHER